MTMPRMPVAAAVLVLAACSPGGEPGENPAASPSFSQAGDVHETWQDNLLTGGLDYADLTTDAAPEDPRDLALYTNWRGLVYLSDSEAYPAPVPGTEIHARLRLPDAGHPFRVMLQVPAGFDTANACLVVSPSSGSRGIYGAVPVAGPWALPRGCAVVYTDKGAGTDYRVVDAEPPLVAMPHAHSGDHPEADWGRHTLTAATWALAQLVLDPGQVRIIAFGLSNGGDAVLRAAELDADGLFDAVVAVAPNVTPPGARPLYDYATEAALLQPCLVEESRCAPLAERGLIESADAASASARLVRSGFDEYALSSAGINVSLDLWRAVAANYASAYLRRDATDMPCGYATGMVDADGEFRMPTPEEQERWTAAGNGIAPDRGAGVMLADPGDSALQGQICLRGLWTGDGEETRALRAAVEAVRATAALPDIPVVIIHGREDGLIPVAFSSRPYVEAARANGHERITYMEIERAQHFDTILAAPGMRERYRPLLPIGWEALDQLFESGEDANLRR